MFDKLRGSNASYSSTCFFPSLGQSQTRTSQKLKHGSPKVRQLGIPPTKNYAGTFGPSHFGRLNTFGIGVCVFAGALFGVKGNHSHFWGGCPEFGPYPLENIKQNQNT